MKKMRTPLNLRRPSLLLLLLLATVFVRVALVAPVAHGKAEPLSIETGGAVFNFPGGKGEPVTFALPTQGGEEVTVTRVESPSFLSRFRGSSEAKAVPVGSVDPFVRQLNPALDQAVLYPSAGGRISDWYLAETGKPGLKHHRVYSRGNGAEEETYEFTNAVLHTTPTGEIQGWYVELPDLSQDPSAKGAPKDLMARAQWTLLHDRIWDLHLHGGPSPDFTIPRPVAYDSALNPLPVSYRVEGEALNRLVFSFSTPSYPAVLDPTLILAQAADAIITGQSDTSTYFFGQRFAIGDLNNDGKNDLAVGSMQYNSSTGRVYIFYQDSTLWGTSSCTTGCLAANADRIIDGQTTSSYFGISVAIDDLNSDSKKDLVVGAYGYSSFTGRAYIFLQDGSWGTSACTTGCLAANADHIITGQTTSNNFGYSIAIGDLNNDSRKDLVIGAYAYSTATGRAYIFYQDATLWGTASCTTGCLAANADHIITGQTTSTAFGYSIAIGDLNNDTLNDLAIGAYQYTTNTGRAYIFYRDATYSGWGTVTCTTGCSAANADHIIQGQSTANSFGYFVAIGDLNSDSRKDLVVSALQYTSSTGRAYIFYQDAVYDSWGTVTCTTGCLAANADHIIEGQATTSSFAAHISIGDLNNDSRNDLAIGAFQYTTSTGRAYIFYQDAVYDSWGTVTCTTGCLAANADHIIEGQATSNSFSTAIAIGDLNNDSRNDLIVGANGFSSSTGRLYIFYQDAVYDSWGTVTCTTGCLAANADTMITGESQNAYFGNSLSIGDLNNDGKADLAVGANAYTSSTGRVYIFYQDSTLWGTSACTTGCLAANADHIIQGETTANAFGQSIAIGDLNNDSRKDLVIGGDAYSTNTGRAYIFYQDAVYDSWGTVTCTTGCLAANADHIIQGQATSNNFGLSLAIGDLNNDSRNDLAISAYQYTTSTGRAYIFYQDAVYDSWGTVTCTTGCLAANADHIITGQATSNSFGISLAIGDLNNDAKGDLVVGASSYSTTTGRAYIFYQDSTLWGTSSCTTGCLAANADHIIQGQTTSNSFGRSIAIGDLDNDARNDLVVSAYGYSSSTGRVYILRQDINYSIGTALFTNSSTTVTGSGTAWTSSMAGGQIKNNTNGTWYTISSVGSATSLTLSAVYSGTTTPSEAYTIATSWGSVACAGTTASPCLAANADTIITGEATTNYFGQALAIGDLNTDGKNDLVACAMTYSANTGRTYVFLQDATLWGTSSCTTGCLAANADTLITGEPTSNFGTQVSLGDLNNDTKTDMAVGAYYYGVYVGRTYLHYSIGQTSSVSGSASVINQAPATPSTVSDGSSAAATPTNVGASVTFMATNVTDPNGDEWYFALCKTDAITAGDNAAPTCPGGSWAISAATSGTSQATAYTTLSTDTLESYAWYAFACDKVVGGGLCSASSQGSGDTGSPFYVNHGPTFGTVTVTDNSSAGTLDTTFSGDGLQTTAVGSNSEDAYSVVLQPDGKIVAAGYSNNGTNDDFAVARYNADGTLDTTFSGDGLQTTAVGSGNDYAYSVALQSDGKIVLGGFSFNGTNNDFAVARYNSDGSLDTSFDTDGMVTTAVGSSDDLAQSVAIQSDGKIVLGGKTYGTNDDFAVVRYTTAGALDTTFDTDGMVTTAVGSSDDSIIEIALQPDGKIVAAGYATMASIDFALARYNSNGSLDTSFDTDGILTTAIGSGIDRAWSVALQSDGKIVLGGFSHNGSNYDFALARYTSAGALDTSFDTDGKQTTAVGSINDAAYSVILQDDGKIVAVGSSNNGANDDFALARYTSAGALDTSFSGDGLATTAVGSAGDTAYGAVLQDDGKIVAAGASNNGSNNDFALARYHSYGNIEPGDTLRFTLANASIDDTDTARGQDTVNMHICTAATTSFDYSTNTCTGGSLVCSATGVNPATSDATCDEVGNTLVPIPTLDTAYNIFKIYTEDSLNAPGVGTNQQTYAVQDVIPTLVGYTTSAVTLTAGDRATVAFSAQFQDNNGEADILGGAGAIFDSGATTNICSAADTNCYRVDPCSVSTAYGTSSQAEIQCAVYVWFNANASANWKAHVDLDAEAGGRTTGFADSSVFTVNALAALSALQDSIAYGSLALGGTSSAQTVTFQNVGNTAIDAMVSGTDMTYTSYSISRAQQHFHETSSGFTWGSGDYALVATPNSGCTTGGGGTCTETYGCLNRDIAIRSSHYDPAGDESIYFKIQIPSVQERGSYTGTVTVASTTSNTCSGTLY